MTLLNLINEDSPGSLVHVVLGFVRELRAIDHLKALKKEQIVPLVFKNS